MGYYASMFRHFDVADMLRSTVLCIPPILLVHFYVCCLCMAVHFVPVYICLVCIYLSVVQTKL